MGLIKFKNLPSLDTPLSAENLNNNFEYLDKNVGDLNNLNTEDKTSVINAINSLNKNYITHSEPIKCGYQIDGKDVYKKIVSTNETINGIVNIPHGIDNAYYIWLDPSDSFFVNGPIDNIMNTYTLPIISYYSNTFRDNVQVKVDKTNIVVWSNSSWGETFKKVFAIKYILND